MPLRRATAAVLLLLAAGAGIGRLAAPTDAATPPPVALVAAAARDLGVKRCLPAISAIGQRAVTGATMQDIMLDWDRQAPDAGPIFSFTGLGAGNQRAGLTLVAVPNGAGGCAVLVERMSGTDRSCASVAASELPGFPGTALIDGVMVYRNPAQAGETYVLMTNDRGCLILRRQSSFRWPARS